MIQTRTRVQRVIGSLSWVNGSGEVSFSLPLSFSCECDRIPKASTELLKERKRKRGEDQHTRASDARETVISCQHLWVTVVRALSGPKRAVGSPLPRLRDGRTASAPLPPRKGWGGGTRTSHALSPKQVQVLKARRKIWLEAGSSFSSLSPLQG